MLASALLLLYKHHTCRQTHNHVHTHTHGTHCLLDLCHTYIQNIIDLCIVACQCFNKLSKVGVSKQLRTHVSICSWIYNTKSGLRRVHNSCMLQYCTYICSMTYGVPNETKSHLHIVHQWIHQSIIIHIAYAICMQLMPYLYRIAHIYYIDCPIIMYMGAYMYIADPICM